MTSAAEMSRELPAKRAGASLEKVEPSPLQVLKQMGTDGASACWAIVRWGAPAAGFGYLLTIPPETLGVSGGLASFLGAGLVLFNGAIIILGINSHIADKENRFIDEPISPLGIIGKLLLSPLAWYDYTKKKMLEK